jgi:acyl-coenzyme A synthetase/AMP-(fatty) acid ligase
MIKSDMSKYDFSTLKYAVTAGEPLNPTVYEKFLETTGLRLMEGYGQTETVVMIANYPWMNPKAGSMGKPAPEYDVVLVGKDNKICDVGEGEIVIRTDKGNPPAYLPTIIWIPIKPITPGMTITIIPVIQPGWMRKGSSGSWAGRTI